MHVSRFKLSFSVVTALRLDGVNVRGYTAYCLLDGLDWTSGYADRYGLYNVDYADESRTRTPKRAAAVYRFVYTYLIDIVRICNKTDKTHR